ncbi:MAG TPA: SDR family NAD(P)-dependent oxidoreductase, partial [Arthrobacter sp.]
EPDGGAVARDVQAAGRRFTGLRADLAGRPAVRELAARLNALDAPVDVLVNNAGTIELVPTSFPQVTGP